MKLIVGGFILVFQVGFSFKGVAQTPTTTPFEVVWSEEFVGPSSNHPATNLDIDKWRAPWWDWRRWKISALHSGIDDCNNQDVVNYFKGFRADHNDPDGVVIFEPDPNQAGDGIVVQRIIPLERGTEICAENYGAPYFYDDCCIYLNNGTQTDPQDPNKCIAPCWEFEWKLPASFQSKQEFRYGFFETRIKLPSLAQYPSGINSSNYGITPNFWLYNTTDDNIALPGTAYSEIDIAEIIGHDENYNPKNHVHTFNAHKIYTGSGEWHLGQTASYPDVHPHLDFSDWKTLGLYWTPDFIRYYLDDVCIFEVTEGAEEFNPLSIILDINFWGYGEVLNPSHTTIPYEYRIDYVKVSQMRTLHCQDNYQGCDVSFVNFGGIWNTIDLGGPACNEQVIGKTSLVASESIVLRENIEFTLNSHLYMDIIPCHETTVYNQ